jgi:hypothetical protein
MLKLFLTNDENYPQGLEIASFRDYQDLEKYLEADKKMWARICRDYLDEKWELITPDGPILLNSRDGRYEYYRRRET